MCGLMLVGILSISLELTDKDLLTLLRQECLMSIDKPGSHSLHCFFLRGKDSNIHQIHLKRIMIDIIMISDEPDDQLEDFAGKRLHFGISELSGCHAQNASLAPRSKPGRRRQNQQQAHPKSQHPGDQ